MNAVSIGQVARMTGLKIPTIRFYEDSGLLPAPARSPNGRRVYAPEATKRLAFIRQARHLGFSLAEVRALLALSDHPERSCHGASQMVRDQLIAIDERIAHLNAMKLALGKISDPSCARNGGDCQIISALSQRLA